MIELKGVRKSFGSLEVLKGIDAEVSKGEVVCVIGPSGSGKSTILRCINGLERYNACLLYTSGQQLRQLRKQHGRSLADVAQACGMSLGLLSQIERGLSSASVKMLHQLAREFGVSVNALLRNAEHTEGEDGGRVARAGTHRYIDLREKGNVKEMYTPPACRSMDLCRATIEPGGSTGNELFVTGQGEQIGVVLKGTLELWVGDRVVLLKEGCLLYTSRFSCTPARHGGP